LYTQYLFHLSILFLNVDKHKEPVDIIIKDLSVPSLLYDKECTGSEI
jgi:hypothetical protein